MTQANYTDITFILDKSGSMEHLTEETIKGFNSFLKDQKKLSDKCCVSLIQFDHEYEVSYIGLEVKKAKKLTTETYKTRGWTALLDAIGKTIKTTGERFSAMKEEERPSKVLFIIITDGQENRSSVYNRSQVREMIDHQEQAYSWNFTFMGSSLDAIADGQSLGIPTFSYSASPIGVQAVYASLNHNTRVYREGSCALYSCDVTPKDMEEQLRKSSGTAAVVTNTAGVVTSI